MPHVTEEIYRGLFAAQEPASSIHNGPWPAAHTDWSDHSAAAQGQLLIQIATTIRRYKSDNSISLGAEIPRLHLVVSDPLLVSALAEATIDIASVTRAADITLAGHALPGLESLHSDPLISIMVSPAVPAN
jgi:valyl-tRNA synthetase